MKRIKYYAAPMILLGVTMMGFQNCSKQGFGTDGGTFNSLVSKYGDPPICDPLSGATAGGAAISADHGLVGQLIYENKANQLALGTPNTFAELVERGTVAPATLYMSSVNVPTRNFSEGFSSEGATPLVDASTGDKLVEWFGIDMVSVIKLGAGDTAGYYQLATISDDGSMLDATLNGQSVRLIDNDQLHSTAAKCSTTAIYLDGKSALPIRYRYFQGPRTAIASIISWRRVSSVTASTSDCAQATINANGWAPIPANNFFLPKDAPANPCQ